MDRTCSHCFSVVSLSQWLICTAGNCFCNELVAFTCIPCNRTLHDKHVLCFLSRVASSCKIKISDFVHIGRVYVLFQLSVSIACIQKYIIHKIVAFFNFLLLLVQLCLLLYRCLFV